MGTGDTVGCPCISGIFGVHCCQFNLAVLEAKTSATCIPCTLTVTTVGKVIWSIVLRRLGGSALHRLRGPLSFVPEVTVQNAYQLKLHHKHQGNLKPLGPDALPGDQPTVPYDALQRLRINSRSARQRMIRGTLLITFQTKGSLSVTRRQSITLKVLKMELTVLGPCNHQATELQVKAPDEQGTLA